MQHGVKRIQLSEQARKSKLEKDRAKIARYRALTKKVLDGKTQKLYTIEALEDTGTILNVNPEFNAVWNYRRNILAHLFSMGSIAQPEALGGDLLMSMEMMKRYPKCYWIWNHRRWCLENSDEIGVADWGRELAISSKVLSMDSRNFHGWQYRRYVVSNMERHAAQMGPEGDSKQLEINLREFQYTTEVINKSTSNFSAWHNRTKLIAKILSLLGKIGDQDPLKLAASPAETEKIIKIFTSPLDLLNHELNLVKTGMFMDADDTSVWLYMQWLLTDDIFVRGLPSETYIAVIHQQLADVNELNDLEKEDSLTGSENVWCLKTIIFLRALLSRKNGSSLGENVNDDSEIQRALGLLVQLDPLRKGHYLDQLSGKASIIC